MVQIRNAHASRMVLLVFPESQPPLAPKSVNLTVTAVLSTADDKSRTDQRGASGSPPASSSTPKQEGQVTRATSTPPAPPKPKPLPTPARTPSTARTCRPSPLAPYWKPADYPTRQRRGRLPPEPLARRALKAHFAKAPHGAAVASLGVRQAVARAEGTETVDEMQSEPAKKPPSRRAYPHFLRRLRPSLRSTKVGRVASGARNPTWRANTTKGVVAGASTGAFFAN